MEIKITDTKTILQRLQAPFPMSDIEFRIGSTNADKTQGKALAYLTNRAIMERLDEVFEPFGWKNEYKDWKGKGVLCGISVRINDEWITKWDGADETEFEATKGGLSDSMKRAAVQWGIGRYLYKLEGQWVSIKQAGKGFKMTQEPKLPAWALPREETQQVFHTPTTQSVHQSVPAATSTSAQIDNVVHIEDKKTSSNSNQIDKSEFTGICSCCGDKISYNVEEFSRRKRGKPMCIDCQNGVIKERKVSDSPASHQKHELSNSF